MRHADHRRAVGNVADILIEAVAAIVIPICGVVENAGAGSVRLNDDELAVITHAVNSYDGV